MIGYWRGAALTILICACAADACAEVKIYTLPADCAEFAFNHDSGDLAMVVPDKNEAWLIRAEDLQSGKVDSPVKLSVGSTPSSIFFKKYKELAVYAVVCAQDSHMYVMNAADGQLVKKIELAQSGIRAVTGSLNSADPIVYYNYGSGHDCATGAVNLRTMQNQPVAFDDSFMSSISASGEVAYRLGPWSPSGFESLIRTSSLSDDKVAFARLFYDHDSKGGYVPDPFDRYTGVSKSIYNRDLSKREADLGFFPQCFFRKSPLVVGFEVLDDFRASREQTQEVKLRAASYNTFSAAGDVVSFSLPRPALSTREDLTRVRRARMFASDVAKQVIYASRQHLVLVPLADFAVPEEPFLLAALSGNGQAFVNQPAKFTLTPADPRIEVVVESTPDGMNAQGKEFTWTPTADQIGLARLAVTLKHGTLQRSQTFDLKVVRPSIELPFAPVDLVMSSDQKRLLIWEGPAIDRFGRPTARDDAASGELQRMALIDAATGALLAEKKAPEAPAQVVVMGDYFVLLSANSPRCDVIRSADLERQKTLMAGAPITSVDALGQMLVLQTQEALELYSLPKLDRISVLANASAASAGGPRFAMQQRGAPVTSGVTPHGLLARGLLLDANLKTALILSVDGLQALPGADPNWRLNGLQATNANIAIQPAFNPGGQGATRLMQLNIPNSKAVAQLDMRTQHRQVPGAIHTNRVEVEVTLNVTGDQPLREIVLKDDRPSDTAQAMQARPPRLALSGKNAFVIVERKVYRTPLPTAGVAAKLALTPRQSALTLSGTGKTTLTHEASGGKTPYKFSVLTSLDAITIDEKTGVITLAEAPLLEEANKAAEQAVTRTTPGNESYLDSFRTKAPALISRAMEFIGRKPTGYPVAIPIRVEVTDAEQATAALQYYIVAEVPSGPLAERLKELEDERQAKLAAAQAARPMGTAADPGNPSAVPGDADTRRRLDALEQRMDNITRQLNEVLKRLDNIKP